MRNRGIALVMIALLVALVGCNRVKSTVKAPDKPAKQPASGEGVSSTVQLDESAKTKIDGNEISFEHIVGSSPCPQLIATITLANIEGFGTIDFEVSIGRPLSATPTSGQFTHEEDAVIQIFFDCSQQTSFEKTFAITHNTLDQKSEGKIVYNVSGNVHR